MSTQSLYMLFVVAHGAVKDMLHQEPEEFGVRHTLATNHTMPGRHCPLASSTWRQTKCGDFQYFANIYMPVASSGQLTSSETPQLL